MPHLRTSRTWSPTLGHPASLSATALLAAGAVGANVGLPSAWRRRPERELGKTVLTDLKGLTLYTLSAETNGKFICKGSCLSV